MICCPLGAHGSPPISTREAEIFALMEAARALPPRLRAATSETLIGLLAVTGMRIGEALGLDRRDVDLNDGALHVRAAKQSKQREVPLHATTVEALRDYASSATRTSREPERRRSSSPTKARGWTKALQRALHEPDPRGGLGRPRQLSAAPHT